MNIVSQGRGIAASKYMDVYYQGIYQDQYGEETIVIHNDGKLMRMTVRGVELVTDDFFDTLINKQESSPTSPIALLRSTNSYWWVLTCAIPVPVVMGNDERIVPLQVESTVTKTENVRYPQTHLTLALDLNGQVYEVKEEDSVFFDIVLLDLQRTLPLGHLAVFAQGGTGLNGRVTLLWGCIRKVLFSKYGKTRRKRFRTSISATNLSRRLYCGYHPETLLL